MGLFLFFSLQQLILDGANLPLGLLRCQDSQRERVIVVSYQCYQGTRQSKSYETCYLYDEVMHCT